MPVSQSGRLPGEGGQGRGGGVGWEMDLRDYIVLNRRVRGVDMMKNIRFQTYTGVRISPVSSVKRPRPESSPRAARVARMGRVGRWRESGARMRYDYIYVYITILRI